MLVDFVDGDDKIKQVKKNPRRISNLLNIVMVLLSTGDFIYLVGLLLASCIINTAHYIFSGFLCNPNAARDKLILFVALLQNNI